MGAGTGNRKKEKRETAHDRAEEEDIDEDERALLKVQRQLEPAVVAKNFFTPNDERVRPRFETR